MQSFLVCCCEQNVGEEMSWESMLKEIIHQENKSHHAKSHHVKEIRQPDSTLHYRYYLGEPYSNVYFTRREAETAIHLILGKTLLATAQSMLLSPRTVEYYTNNMKHKLQCRRKADLIARVMSAEFIKVSLLPLMETL